MNDRVDPGAGRLEMNGPGRAYLGLFVERLDPALVSQLARPLGNDRGVLVRHVEPGTPAAQAGFQEYDIVVKFGRHALASPRDLIETVRQGSPGNKVDVQILRGGERKSLSVVLGDLVAPRARNETGPLSGGLPDLRDLIPDEPLSPSSPSPSVPPVPSAPSRTGVQGFEALSIRHTGPESMEIDYSCDGPRGKTERYTFRGTVSEIRKQIDENQLLNAERKAAILKAIETTTRATRELFGTRRPFAPVRPESGTGTTLDQLLQEEGSTERSLTY